MIMKDVMIGYVMDIPRIQENFGNVWIQVLNMLEDH
eukprot:CAMPEP_0114662174 /NCGR_PEP_ID=MMETSP0191-20121206/24256_1 /TAXON_ID=126664 /ORGANISM="Sorites sp." /LENGTH=35 /DNA_ID= /DNA_START= /DNA_END= /DNA_ORIENTATION=